MSPNSWQEPLQQLLEQQTARQSRPPRTAILGIGNTLRSDDAAGVLVARRLADAPLIRDLDSVRVIDAGHAPENATTGLRLFQPDIVILIDAAEMGRAPGEYGWIRLEEIDGMSASTHTLPLSMLAKYLTLEFGCEVRTLGIQLKSNDIGETVSREVLQSVAEIADGFAQFLATIPSTNFQV